MNNPAQRPATKEDRQKQYSAMEIIDGQPGHETGRPLLRRIRYLFFPEELPCNHQALNLARAFANRA